MTTTAQIPDTDDSASLRRAHRNVAVLVAAQAIIGAQMPMLFVVAGLAGLMLAPSPALATVPISLIVFSSMTTAPWLSPLMQRRGRVPGFLIGAGAGALGAAISAVALITEHFPLFLLGAYFTGIYMSAQGFFRFAATDAAPDSFKPKAISYVMAGGLLAALLGPQLVKATAQANVIPFLGTYLAAIVLNIVGAGIFLGLDLPKPKPTTSPEAAGRSRAELLRDPKIRVAMICGAVSYALMSLMMTSTPLAVVGCGFSTGNAADIVSAHVIAMYAPSFFTGHLINRFGTARIMTTGLALLAAAGGVALMGAELAHFFGALILLGIGWNFGFIGATTLLITSHSASERGTVQGINDFVVFGCVTIASFSSGLLMNSGGEDVIAGWSAVNFAMVPFLILAGGALVYLRAKSRTRPA